MTDEASPNQTDWQAPGISTLYLFRAGFSAVWITSVYVLASSARGSTPSILAGVLLVIYPLSDVVATIFDIRATRAAPAAPIPQYANIAAGSTAACAILIALFSDLPAAITAFGVWAITAGGLQLLLAERRRGAFRGQWLMIISGAGSVLAGITFLARLGRIDKDRTRRSRAIFRRRRRLVRPVRVLAPTLRAINRLTLATGHYGALAHDQNGKEPRQRQRRRRTSPRQPAQTETLASRTQRSRRVRPL
jgi:hypothetical protein